MQREQTGISLPKATFTPVLAGTETSLVPGKAVSRPVISVPSFGKRVRDDAAPAVPTGKLAVPTDKTAAYELAFLRGGGKEVLRLHLFDLLQRGHLAIVDVKGWFSTKTKLAKAENPPPHSELTGLEHELRGWFVSPREASDIYGQAYPEALKSACAAHRAKLEAEGLLRPRWPARVIPIAAGLTAFALTVSLIKFPPAVFVGFLLGALVAAGLSKFTRLTRAGREHLAELQARFEPVKERALAARLDEIDPALIWGVAAFGVSILAGSSYDAFAAVMAPNGSNGVDIGGWSGGSDTSCGGSGCGGCGSGCGGGCGGCGGCGG